MYISVDNKKQIDNWLLYFTRTVQKKTLKIICWKRITQLLLWKTFTMATITLGGTPVDTLGELPSVGEQIKNVNLTQSDLQEIRLHEYLGQSLVLNIFPSIDTGICATSTRKFNEAAAALENTKILCISRDLPFAQARFCAAEGIEQVLLLSDFRTLEFGKEFGVEMINGNFKGLLARAVIVVNPEGQVVYTELVPEVGQEPNYAEALAACKA